MRVLVVGPNGAPYPSVDDIKLVNSAKKVNSHLRGVPLTTIDPPASWKRIQYHVMTALPPTGDASAYSLRVQAGSKKGAVAFRLAAGEFKQIVITLP
jgi:hypothetical protein